MSDTALFPATRTAALKHLQDFLPRARDYSSKRNYDYGPGQHSAVSTLSPYIRHRLLTEEEVLEAVLARYSLRGVDKFVQEVFWRTYWKGWLEMRPSVWGGYRAGLMQRWDEVQTQSGLRAEWEAACLGQTGIDAFDHWAKELVETGYLHNHARMWFASIWIFTLRLPWELGADFFLRHLLDGDPASNTLSWRWVAGLQTQGKNYVARASNISKYTEGRLSATGLAQDPAPLDGPPHPPRMPMPDASHIDPGTPAALILHEDDLSPGYLFDLGLKVQATAVLSTTKALSPLHVSDAVTRFKTDAYADVTTRWADQLGPVTHVTSAEELHAWTQTQDTAQVVTPYAPVGPAAEVLNQLSGLPVRRIRRSYDSAAWPYATAGFFKFKQHIPKLAGALKGLRVA